MVEKIPVGILGATGMVGQRFIQLLDKHPQFEIKCLGASQKSAGKSYAEACNWKLDTPMPERIRVMQVKECRPEDFKCCCQIIFSGLDSSVAGELEGAFRDADFPVFSNAKNYRMHADVPLCVPLVNADHLDLVAVQRQKHGLKHGFIVTNANCSTTGLVVALKPLHDAFRIKQLQVCTMQAISGAGYPGISALDILGNVVPYIGDEESKIETEPLKILAQLSADKTTLVQPQNMSIDATCNRVPVVDGHTECVSINFETVPESIDHVRRVLESYQSEAQRLKVHSAPEQAIYVLNEQDRPQPKLDLMAGGGYSVSVGRLRKGNSFHVKFTMLSHNTILGAAGSSIMNAELAIKKGLLQL